MATGGKTKGETKGATGGETKSALRKEILKKRDSLSVASRHEKDKLIKERLFLNERFLTAKRLMFFASFRSEPDTIEMIKECLKMNKTVALPKVNVEKHALELYYISDLNDLSIGYKGIPEPLRSERAKTSLSSLDVIIMPGAAFDKKGGRLGYGGGYYDRLLSANNHKNPLLIAIAYDLQIVEKVPALDHDVKVDVIITDKRVINSI
ncbi:5-formyltetrahydrofolate cyclo-ligase [Candidatus Magnetoovum chiemensis]|nr:5-formyltetrahydrofolate cyclo-ligase [Candidatus Magnetoovum chiemensis]